MSGEEERPLVLTAAAEIRDELVAAVIAAAPAEAVQSPPERLGARGVALGVSGTALEPARRAAAAAQADVNPAPGAPRKKRLLICDMDSTIITIECIDEVAALAGVGDEVRAITERAMRGELDFEGSLEARVALLEGLPEAALAEAFETRLALSPGAETMVRTMRASGAVTALVSGGFTYFSARVAEMVGFELNQANRLILSDGALTGRVETPILGRDAKREAMDRIFAERGLAPEDALAVGDGANDLAMIRRAGFGVAYRAKPVVAAEADARLDHSDLTALLYLQGYREAEFAA